ncbi:MAG TPA: hypothetical protein VJR22_04770 [Candidatus Nitrosotalea sp.]|nr:hypothetical protein [Nitrososphaerota archaeon]HKU33138.1 hypothetical protein [Candidatus Nitrosotalea sp.]
MIRQNKNFVNLKMVVFIAIYASLIAFSLAWYHTLTNINCDLTQPISSNSVKADSSEGAAQNCSEQLHFHWIKFYGINGLIYGASLFAFVTSIRKSNKS